MALVGNYEQYAKALDVAANAEDAGTLQALKTMDSISSKWAQLKVSVQEFYASSGLEDVFKGLLDSLTAFLTKANTIPKLFGKIPVPILALVGSLISSIKSVATSSATAIVEPLNNLKQKLNDLKNGSPLKIKVKSEVETPEETQQTVNTIQQRLNANSPLIIGDEGKNPKTIVKKVLTPQQEAIKEYLTSERNSDDESQFVLNFSNNIEEADKELQRLNSLSDAEREAELRTLKLNRTLEDNSEKAQDSSKQIKKQSETFNKVRGVLNKYSAGIGLATSALSALALSMKDSSSAGVETSKVLSGLANSAGGAARIIGGDVVGGVMQLIAGIPALFDGLNYSIEEQIQNAEKEFNDAKNESLLKKDDFRTLQNDIDELDKLEEARYDSAEAAEAYQTAVDQLAEAYPQLIEGFDSMGNVIIDTSNAEELLANTRRESADAALEAAKAEYNLRQKEVDKAEKDVRNAREGLAPVKDDSGEFVTTGFGKTINLGRTEKSYADIFSGFGSYEEAIVNEFYSIPESELSSMLSVLEEQGLNITEDLNLDDLYSAFQSAYDSKDLLNPIIEGYFGQLLDLTKYATEMNNETFSDADAKRKSILNELEAASQNENLTAEGLRAIMDRAIEYDKKYNDTFFEYLTGEDGVAGVYLKALNEQEIALASRVAASKQIISSAISGMDTDDGEAYEFVSEAEGLFSLVNKQIYESYQEALKESPDGLLDPDKYIEDNKEVIQQTLNETEQFWNSLTDEQQTAFNELIKNQDSYNPETFRKALEDIGVEGETAELLYNNFKNSYGKAFSNFRESIRKINSKNKELGFSQIDADLQIFNRNLSEELFNYVREDFEYISEQVRNGLITDKQGQSAWDNYANIFAQINSIEDETLRGQALEAFKNFDFSLEGINSLLITLQELGVDSDNITDSANELKRNISVNLVTSWDSFLTSLSKEIDSISESLDSVLKGLSAEDAFKLIESKDLSINDFKVKDGKFFLNNIEAIKTLTESSFNTLYEDLNSRTDKVASALRNLERGAVVTTVDGKAYTQEDTAELNEIITKSSQATITLQEYETQVIGNLLLEAGNIEAFANYLSQQLPERGLSEGAIQEALASGDINTINELIPEFAGKVNDIFANVVTDTYSAAISALEDNGLIEVTDFNKATLEALKDAEVIDAIDEHYATLAEDASTKLIDAITGNEQLGNTADQNALIAQILSQTEHYDVTGAITSMIQDPLNISLETLTEFANGKNLDLQTVINSITAGQNEDGTYASSLQQILNSFNIFGITVTSEIQDAINEYLNGIISIFSSGLGGTMTNTQFTDLSNFFGGKLDLDFTRTAEGLKLTKASAIEVYTELQKIDSIQAQIAFNDLAENLKEAGSGYETVADTMRTIAELNKELADVPVSDARRQELERELAVAEDILRVRSQDPDSFNFMDQDLPTGMQGPENYWNSVGEAYKVMNEAASSGYMEIQDYVNIVRQMESMAVAAGQEFAIGGMNAAQLIEKGMSALTNIDGEGVKIAMESVGIDFANGATDMGLSFDDGIKEMARSQIKMLDAAIRMLEAMVAMEEIDAGEDGVFQAGEIFDKNGNFFPSVENFINRLNVAAGGIEINGRTFKEALLSLEPDKVAEIFNQLKNIDWTLGDTDIFAQVQNILQAFYPGASISTSGPSIFEILKVPDDAETNLEAFNDWVEKAGISEAQAKMLLERLKAGTANFQQTSSMYDVLKKAMGLEEVQSEKFDNFYKVMQKAGYQTTQIVQAWNDIEVDAETGESLYTDSNGVQHKLDGDGSDWNNQIGKIEEQNVKDRISGQKGYSGRGEITPVTLENGTEVECLLEVEGNKATVYYNGEPHTVSGRTAGQAVYEAKQWVRRQAQQSVDSTRTESKATISETVEINGKIVTKITYDDGTVEYIDSKGNKYATSGEVADAGLEEKARGLAAEEESKTVETEANLEVNSITEVTFSEEAVPEDGLTLPAGQEIKLTGAATNLEITSIINPPTLKLSETTEGLDLGDIGTVTGQASSLTITLPENLSDTSIAQLQSYNEILSAISTLGTVTSGITATITGLEDTQDIKDYSEAIAGAPTGDVSSTYTGTIDIPLTDLALISQLKQSIDAIKANPEISTTVKAEAIGNGITTLTQLLEAYGYSNAGEVANLIINATDATGSLATISAQIAQLLVENYTIDFTASLNDEEAKSAIAELTKDETKTITVTYDAPTRVGPGADTSNPGYAVYGVHNDSGNQTKIGQYKSIELAGKDIVSKVENGTFQNGTFEIEQINADGTTVTTTATLVDLVAGTVKFNGANPDSSTNTGHPTPYSGSNNANNNNKGSTPTVLPPIDTSQMMASIQTAADSIGVRLGNAGQTGGAKAAAAIQKTLDGIKSKRVSISVDYPKTVSIGVKYSISVSVSATGAGVTGAKGRIIGGTNLSSFGANSASGSAAKGIFDGKAFAAGTKKTLVGELGPELVVSNGRYFLVGQNGAEFVDLADDAIVFNHLQTKKLLGSGSSGRGTAITNEKNAVSFATGNVDGPAMASASDALAQLRQIRAMWQALLDASAKDLGSKAGSGGGGGGGGGGGEGIKAITGELERWYNLLRQIDSLEQHITLEQAKRANMQSGYKYVDSLEKELEMLKEQQKAYKTLADLQKDYYDRRREDLLSTDYSKIFTYTEHGLMQYVDGPDRGLDILAKLNERDATGKLINNAVDAKAQIAYLNSIGFNTSILKYNDDGTEAENEEGMMENFWNNVDGWMDELDGLYDSYHEATINFEESTNKINEILQEYIDNQLAVEQKLLKAIEDREQAEIDRIQDEKDALEEASQAYIDGLNDALNKERDMYNRNQTQEETARLQRRLAVLQRSGASASEIKALQEQIDSRLQDAYFDKMQEQIDAVQQASDNQLEKLQIQIDLMTETLEYQKENGLLWEEVYEMMNKWTPEQMLQFIEEYMKSYKENSALQNQEDSEETLQELEMYTAKRDLEERDAAWAEYYNNLTGYSEELKQKHADEAQQAFNDAYVTGGLEAAKIAADEVYAKAKKSEDEAVSQATQTPSTPAVQENTNSQNGSLEGGKMYVRNKPSSRGEALGIVRSGKTFKAVGYAGGWLKVEDADIGGKKVSGYMKYDKYEKYYRGLDVKKLPAYKNGGLIDFTGPAMVHGSKTKPESIISAEQTKLLKEGIFSNSNHSLSATVAAIQELADSLVKSSDGITSPVTIENAQVTVEVASVANDYDSRKIGELALEEMVRISRKTANRMISRR